MIPIGNLMDVQNFVGYENNSILQAFYNSSANQLDQSIVNLPVQLPMEYNTPGYSAPLLPGFKSFYGPRQMDSFLLNEELNKRKQNRDK